MITRIDSEWSSAKVLRADTLGDGMYKVFTKRWWMVTSAGDMLIYDGEHPQCNLDKRVLEAKMKESKYAAAIVYKETVFLPVEYRCQYV